MNFRDEFDTLKRLDGEGILDPTTALAKKQMEKEADNVEKVMKEVTPEKQKEPKKVVTKDLKKMHLSEEIFNKSKKLNEVFSPSTPEWLKGAILKNRVGWEYNANDINRQIPSGYKRAEYGDRDRKRKAWKARGVDLSPYTRNNEYIIRDLLGKIDFNRAKFIDDGTIPQNARDPRLKSPNIPFFLVKMRNGGLKLFVKGFTDDEDAVTEWDKPGAFKYHSMKDILEHTVGFCYIDGSDPDNLLSPRSAEYPNDVMELKSNYRFPKSWNGHRPWVPHSFFGSSGYYNIDKSGYIINPHRYAEKLRQIQKNKLASTIERCYDQVVEVRKRIIDLLESTDFKQRDSVDRLHSAYEQNIFRTFADVVDYYNEIVKSSNALTYANESEREAIANDLLDDYGYIKKFRRYLETLNSILDRYTLTELDVDEYDDELEESFYKLVDTSCNKNEEALLVVKAETLAEAIDIIKPRKGTTETVSKATNEEYQEYQELTRKKTLDEAFEDDIDERNTLWNRVYQELDGHKDDPPKLVPWKNRYEPEQISTDSSGNIVVYIPTEEEAALAKEVADFFGLEINISKIPVVNSNIENDENTIPGKLKKEYKATIIVPPEVFEELPHLRVSVNNIDWDLQDDKGVYTPEELDLPTEEVLTISVASENPVRVKKSIRKELEDQYGYPVKSFDYDMIGKLIHTPRNQDKEEFLDEGKIKDFLGNAKDKVFNAMEKNANTISTVANAVGKAPEVLNIIKKNIGTKPLLGYQRKATKDDMKKIQDKNPDVDFSDIINNIKDNNATTQNSNATIKDDNATLNDNSATLKDETDKLKTNIEETNN